VSALPELGRERFVSVATYRRDGSTVATPVWVVDRGDALLVWTGSSTGKVKRLRRDPRLTLAPCSRRGRVAPDAEPVAARATVEDDPAVLADAERLLARKYGVEYRLVTLVERVVGALGRRSDTDHRVVLRIVAS
jgi:uncharacterized protein